MPSRRTLLGVAGALAAVGIAKALLVMLDRLGIYTFETPYAPMVLGVIIGLTYGLLAVGLVLVYRTSKIINFSHGAIGAFGATVFGLIVAKYHLPYWLVLPVGLFVAGGIGAITEAVVVRRLRSAPRLMSVVATLGVSQVLLQASAAIDPVSFGLTNDSFNYFPIPPLPSIVIGSLHVAPSYTGILFMAPVAVLGITAFLRWSRFGVALQASSANPDSARMAGIFAGRMSGLAWAIAGALSALSAILTQAAAGFNSSAASFGPNLLLRAVAAAVLARMTSLPVALIGGVGIGVMEQLLLWNYPQGGVVEIALLAVILLALLMRRPAGGRDEDKGSWAAIEALRPVPRALREIWLVRNLGRLLTLVCLVPVAVLPFVMSNTSAERVNGMIAFAAVGLAVGLLTGLGGQLTLGQFAVAGLGAVASYHVTTATQNFPLGILCAGLAAAAVSVLLGLPALRVRGLMLTVTTLAFALAAPTLLTWLLGGRGVLSGRPVLPNGKSLDLSTEYYWFALALFLVCLWLARNVRTSGFGRLLIAVRDNENGARAFSVRAWRVKLRGYALAGFIAGLGGAILGHSLLFLTGSAFPAEASTSVVVMTVIGGAGLLAGPILGALLVIGVPAFVPLDAAGLAATQAGLLILILYMPGGLAKLVGVVRDKLIGLVARAHGIDLATVTDTQTDATVATTPVHPRAAVRDLPSVLAAGPKAGTEKSDGALLEATLLRKRFGGVRAVDGVSLTVNAGETVGLIGPNGAGKTTTFELLSGFTKADEGTVRFDGRDVGAMGPERRGQLGLIRSFQDAALFPTMTVTDSVIVALERIRPTGLLSAVTGWSSGERTKQRQAREIISLLGLDRYRDARIRELSTGTRRIAEFACLVALRPRLLLLDEPSSGIAQRETEAMAHLLGELKAQLGLTLLIIEHDIPLIMSISDRVIAMANGVVIKTGTPIEVSADQTVADAYLGRGGQALQRSDTTVADSALA